MCVVFLRLCVYLRSLSSRFWRFFLFVVILGPFVVILSLFLVIWSLFLVIFGSLSSCFGCLLVILLPFLVILHLSLVSLSFRRLFFYLFGRLFELFHISVYSLLLKCVYWIQN